MRKISTKKLVFAAICSVLSAFALGPCTVGTLFVGKSRGKEIIVIPSFEGEMFSEIDSPKGIILEKECTYSEDVEQGVVISQLPPEGSRRVLDREGVRVKLTVSLGEKKNFIPQLKDVDSAEAVIALRQIGARPRLVYLYSDVAVSDTVIKTYPPAQSEIKEGELVTVYVSRARRQGSLRVRDFSGLALEDASFFAMSDGLCIGQVEREYSDTVDEGYVISQSLAPNILVKEQTYIDLIISAGSEPRKCADDEPREEDKREEPSEKKGFFGGLKRFFN